MPTIEVSHKDLCKLIGKKLTIEEMKDAILFAKGEIESVDDDLLKVDIKDSNRPDLWSTEGIAREIQGRITKNKGLPKYKLGKSKVVVKVDKKVSKVRPLTVCAVAKGLKINEDVLSQMIQLQEKISVTFGRNRKEVAIGAYDLHKIKSPIKYTTVKPEGIKFIPLEFTEELTPKEILEKHPKGKEFGHLLKGYKEYPIFIDSGGNVLSLPPIINSDYTGKVTEDTKDIFIECSGFNFKFLIPALNVIVSALADRGAKIETVKVIYPDSTVITPDLTPKKSFVSVDYANKVFGLKLTAKEICKLLEQARYEAKANGKKIDVLYPAYRQDIMHQRDVVEDIIISYDYNKVEPVIPKLTTVGKIDEKEIFSNRVADVMVSLGLQEILSYTLTNKENLFKKMNLKEEEVIEIENPVSANWNVFRNWLLPSLMEFFSNNQHIKYPQNIFEIGDIIVIDRKQETKTRDIRKLSVAISDSKVGYYDILAILDAFMSTLGKKYELKKGKHSSFIEGRVADIVVGKKVGLIGEIHPLVLKNWKLEMPVAAFEINLEGLKNSEMHD